MVADMGPETEHRHHRHTGHRWLDVLLGICAVVISLVSLFLAIQHGRVMERMLEASTWPSVMVGNSNAAADGSHHVTLYIVNKGVGPARIESVEVFYNGVAQTDSQSLLRAILKPSDPNRQLSRIISDVTGTVVSAGERINFLDVIPKDYGADEYSLINDAWAKLDFRTCYCSVFEECWIFDERISRRPEAVKSCQVPKTPFLH